MTKSLNYHHGNLREKILETAFELLDKEGVEGVGIRKIARIIGVAHSAPANHFKNKQSLLMSLAAESFRHLNLVIETESPKEAGNLNSAIQSFGNTILEFGLKFPNRYKLLWRREYTINQADELSAAMDNIYAQLTSILTVHAKSKQVDVESQAIALWSLVHGYVLLRLDGNLEDGYDVVTGLKRQIAIIDVLINGIVK